MLLGGLHHKFGSQVFTTWRNKNTIKTTSATCIKSGGLKKSAVGCSDMAECFIGKPLPYPPLKTCCSTAKDRSTSRLTAKDDFLYGRPREDVTDFHLWRFAEESQGLSRYALQKPIQTVIWQLSGFRIRSIPTPPFLTHPFFFSPPGDIWKKKTIYCCLH